MKRSAQLLGGTDLPLTIYRSLLFLYPRSYREEYGPHMVQVFGDCYHRSGIQSDPLAMARFWSFALLDLLKTAFEERSAQRIELTARNLVRLTGIAAFIGGALWIRVIAVMASRPAGITYGPHRQTGDLMPDLLLAMLLIVIGLAGAHARQFAHSRWIGIPAAVAVVTGVLLFWLAPLFGNWGVAMAGYIFFVFGSLFSGAVMLLGRAFPRWASPLLIVSSLVFLGFNTEDARALLALPFGAAAMVLGAALIRDDGRQLLT